MISINRKDKIKCIKDGLSKESLENIHLTLEVHLSGDIHRVLIDLFRLFQDEKERYHPKDLITNDPVCQFFIKVEGRADP